MKERNQESHETRNFAIDHSRKCRTTRRNCTSATLIAVLPVAVGGAHEQQARTANNDIDDDHLSRALWALVGAQNNMLKIESSIPEKSATNDR